MRDIAIVAAAQADNVPSFLGNEIEMLMPVVKAALQDSGLKRGQIGVTTASSNDFFAGQAFAFVRALDAIGAYPVIDDSHLDMDGAWALFEAWIRLQSGEVDTALVYALGRTSAGQLHEITPLQYDPYYLQLTGIDPTSMAALQAHALMTDGIVSETAMAEVVERSYRNAVRNDQVWHCEPITAAQHLASPYLASPLRERDCFPQTDGAACVILAADTIARDLCEHPVWIRGIDHRIDPHYPGVRDLSVCPSARLAAEHAGVGDAPIDFAELSATYSHEEILLRRELALGDSVDVNPSGGALTANPIMATGLIRFVEVFERLRAGAGKRALAHAASGPCLQQNLVAVLEVD